MVVKVKENFEKTRHVTNIFYEDQEMEDITIEFYLIKRNLIIKISLNFIISHDYMPILSGKKFFSNSCRKFMHMM